MVIVTRKAAQGGESVRRKGHEVSEPQAPRDVLYVRIQAPVFMHHYNAGQFRNRRGSRVGTGRPDEISLDAAVAAWRRNGFIADPDPFVGLRYLLPIGVVGHQ